MGKYKIEISKNSNDFLNSLDEKSQRICRDNLKKLETNPYPGKGVGDKEKIVIEGEEVYRLHVGRSYTAFYVILEDENIIRVIELLPIDKAHKRLTR